jgi:O-antigen ligase
MTTVFLALLFVLAPRRAARPMFILIAFAVVAVLLLSTVAQNLYIASIRPRLGTLISPKALLASDDSLGYRLIEWSTVREAVGSRVLFGRGLGAEHRAVYWLNPPDPALWTVLASYVHNSFLWAFLKAGLVGVCSTGILYVGLLAQSLRARSASSWITKQIGRSFSVAVLALIGVGFFNAHIASARYMIVVGAAFGMLVGKSLPEK